MQPVDGKEWGYYLDSDSPFLRVDHRGLLFPRVIPCEMTLGNQRDCLRRRRVRFLVLLRQKVETEQIRRRRTNVGLSLGYVIERTDGGVLVEGGLRRGDLMAMHLDRGLHLLPRE